MAGYGIRAYLIAQSLNQISKAYGETNAILDNCHVRIAFSSNDERTAERTSDCLGHRHRAPGPAQLRRPPPRAVAQPCHGLAPGDSPAAPDTRRGDVASRPRTSWSSSRAWPPSGPGSSATTRTETSRAASPPAPELATDGLRRPAAAAPRRLERPGAWPPPSAWRQAADAEAALAEEESGLQQQRHPGLAEEDRSPGRPAHDPAAELDVSATTIATRRPKARAMDRLRPTTTSRNAHAMNLGEGPHRDPDDDLLPAF